MDKKRTRVRVKHEVGEGRRQGVGRRSLWGEKQVAINVTVPRHYAQFLLEMGRGNFSEGVRLAAQALAREAGRELEGQRPEGLPSWAQPFDAEALNTFHRALEVPGLADKETLNAARRVLGMAEMGEAGSSAQGLEGKEKGEA